MGTMGWIGKAIADGIEGLLDRWEKSLNERIERLRRGNGQPNRTDWTMSQPNGHLGTDEFVRVLVRQSLISQNGEVSMAVKSWKASDRKAFMTGKFEEGAEQRYMVNPEAVLNKGMKSDAFEEPEAFGKQREWEQGLVPGKLYRVSKDLELIAKMRLGGPSGKHPILEKGTIVMLVSVGGFEENCEKTGNFTTAYEPTPGDTYAVKVYGQREDGVSFSHTMVRNGMFGSKNFDEYYMPLVKQSWLAGERVIDWSFTYDELEEICSHGLSR